MTSATFSVILPRELFIFYFYYHYTDSTTEPHPMVKGMIKLWVTKGVKKMAADICKSKDGPVYSTAIHFNMSSKIMLYAPSFIN